FTVLAFPVRAIGWLLAELPRSVAGWDRVQRVLSATGEMRYGTRELARTGPATLRFDGVSFGYGRQRVLHDVTFTVPAGRTVALVGPTGAGKSTIASLATRLLDPDAGAITLDGVALPELSAAALTRSVALVPQVAFGFDDTVRANVSLDRPGIDDAAVWRALRLAQADGFVAALPEGLATMVGERGTSLSGGRRRGLALARALAGEPRLLILDDATSAVAPRVEAAILAGLRGGGTTILVVAYRRATIALADEVVYLEHGRVVAHGSPPELLAQVPGYANLVTAPERAAAERARGRGHEEPARPPARAGRAVTAEVIGERPESILQTLRRGLALSPELRTGLAGTLLLALVWTGGRVAVPVAVQQGIDHGLLAAGGPDLGVVAAVVALTAAALVVTTVCGYAMMVRLFTVTETALAGVRVRAFRHVHDLSMLHQQAERRGSLTSRVTSDVDIITQFLQFGGVIL